MVFVSLRIVYGFSGGAYVMIGCLQGFINTIEIKVSSYIVQFR